MLRREILIFLVVGIATVLVDFSSYQILIKINLVNLSLAKACSFMLGTVFAYIAHSRWTFRASQHNVKSLGVFVILYLFTLSLNVVVNLSVLNMFSQLHYVIYIAFLLATGVSAGLNFFGMKFFVFKNQGV
jgi:putative flippase GtrA